MENLLSFVSPNLSYALGWMVVHSLWQATLIAIISGIVGIFLRKKSARIRYALHNLALVAVLISAVSTFGFYANDSKNQTPKQPQAIENQSIATDGVSFKIATEGFKFNLETKPNSENFDKPKATTNNQDPLSIEGITAYFNTHLYFIVTIWLMGVGLFLLRLLGGISYVYYLKSQHNFPADEYWAAMLANLSKRAGVTKTIELLESALVRSPIVIGLLKPVILFPIGILNRLNPQEVEAILAHELAHVMRHDYLFNILQSIIEALFYYHPAVWWMSANIRSERENCCDDVAIQLCGNSMTYAKSLVAVQDMQMYSPLLSMGFAGQRRNQLLGRVQRVLNQSSSKTTVMEKLITTSFIILTLVALTLAQPAESSKTSSTITDTPSATVNVQPNSVTINTGSSSKTYSTNFNDSTIPRFYSPIALTPEIERLKKELAEVEAAFPNYEKRKEAQIAELEKELAEMEAKMPQHEQKINAEIAQVEKELAEAEKAEPNTDSGDKAEIAKREAEIAKREKELLAYEQKVKEQNVKIKAEIEVLKKEREGKSGRRLQELNGEIMGLQGEMQGNMGELQGIRGEIQGLLGEIQGIKGERQGKRGELQGKYGEIQGKRGELQGKHGEIQGKRGEIQGKRGEIQGRQGQIQGKAGEIEGRIAESIFKALVADLKADNIITDDRKLTIRLNASEFYVNDIKQADAVFEKYKAKYVKIPHWGIYIMKRNGNMQMNITDDENK